MCARVCARVRVRSPRSSSSSRLPFTTSTAGKSTSAAGKSTSTAASTASASSARVPASAAAALALHRGQRERDVLTRALEDFDELVGGAAIILGEKRKRLALLTRATGATDPVHVIFNLEREIVHDDGGDAWDVEPARGDVCLLYTSPSPRD